jgi:HlyD family secretion protein
MRLPRIRFTIGRLMVAVLMVGVAVWTALVILRINEQATIAKQARARYKQAVLVREVADYALKEYVEGIYKQDQTVIHGQIALARSDQERAIDRLKWSTEMKRKGLVSPATNVADQLTKQQADFDLEQAETQLKVLEEYTKEKQIKLLKSDIEKARADEQSKLSTYRREESRRWWNLLGF